VVEGLISNFLHAGNVAWGFLKKDILLLSVKKHTCILYYIVLKVLLIIL
jgi:hypothetical protein